MNSGLKASEMMGEGIGREMAVSVFMVDRFRCCVDRGPSRCGLQPRLRGASAGVAFEEPKGIAAGILFFLMTGPCSDPGSVDDIDLGLDVCDLRHQFGQRQFIRDRRFLACDVDAVFAERRKDGASDPSAEGFGLALAASQNHRVEARFADHCEALHAARGIT